MQFIWKDIECMECVDIELFDIFIRERLWKKQR